MPMEPLGLSSWRWSNNAKSLILLAFFPAILMAVVAATALGTTLFFKLPDGSVDPGFLRAWNIAALVPLSPTDVTAYVIENSWVYVIGAAAVWCVVGYFINSALIRYSTGASPISRTEYPKLYNLLENLCISRGIKMPSLCIIDTPSMNAFASGVDDRSYAITVTKGLVDTLDDAELEAVLAHELSHIRHNDVRLLIITIVFTGMLSFFAHMLWRMLRHTGTRHSRSRRNGDKKGIIPMMIVASIMFAIGYLLAIMLRLAVSRKREYLADAGAVELTKNPDALASALQKISGNAGLEHVSPEVQQLFIENPPSFMSWFDTHPPIESRIKVLRALS